LKPHTHIHAHTRAALKRRSNYVAWYKLISAAVGGQDIVLTLLKRAIKKNAATTSGFLIDGYPRELDQGIRFEAEVADVERVIYFQVFSRCRLFFHLWCKNSSTNTWINNFSFLSVALFCG